MTTIQDVDSTTVEITTEAGQYSINSLRQIADLSERAHAASAVARETERLGDEARSRRDLAALVMIEPYQIAQRPYDAAMERIDAALESAKIDSRTANQRRDKAKEARRKAMVGVEVKPVDVYKHTIGVSRGLFVRLLHRAPNQLPEIENAREVALMAKEDCQMYDAINVDARIIRDEAITVLLNGDRKAGIKAISNADVARLTGLTTARVAQLRYGTR
jgi:dienelactone hydrolase